MGQIIKEREKKGTVGIKKGDFIDEMLQKGNLNDEEKVSVAIDILLAGYETTSGLLALVVYFIAQSPSVLHQLKVHYFLSIFRRSGILYVSRVRLLRQA